MCDNLFIRYPIRNKYEYWLPQINILNSDNIGGLNLKDIHIWTDPDLISDGHSEDYRFNTFHCNNIENDESAWMVGLELISLLRGLVTIFYGEHYQQNIYLERMKKDGDPSVDYPNYKLGNDISLPADIYQTLGSNLFNNLILKEREEYRKNAKTNIFNSSLYLAQENIGVYLIIKYFSQPLTWVNLYRVMETLNTLKNHHDKDWIVPYSKSDFKKFSNPANDFSVVGIDSRHGFTTESLKPNNTKKMELGEAKTMFINCAHSYLNFKLQELRQT